MKLTRTVIATLLASTLLAAPAEAGAWKWIKRAAVAGAVIGVSVIAADKVADLRARFGHFKDAAGNIDIETLMEMVEQIDNIQQIGWQAMLAGQTLPACNYFHTRIPFSEAGILQNPQLFSANHLCCKTRELELTALSAFVVENAPLLAGTKANEATEEVVDIAADLAGRDKLADEMNALAERSTQTVIEQCQIVTGAYAVAQEL